MPSCRHHDVQVFDGIRCCLACGETVFDSTPKQDIQPRHAGVVAYQYANLNYALGHETRLVTLFPGQQSDDIDIDIVHVNINDKPGYEAISYSWATQNGDASLSQTVYCRGRSISVTKHCEAALRCLRRQGRKRCLWVDAISIDQTNIAERNHQVTFMSEIYKAASQVLIYLGPGDENTDRMFDILNGDACTLQGVKRDRLGAVVRNFLQQRWFDRVWVLQEVAFANLATFIAGDKTTQWDSDTINKVLAMCSHLDVAPPSALYWEPASTPTGCALDVLHRSRNCNATDPRDKVFAVLGLMDRNFRDEISVDYSLCADEIFMKLAIHTINNRQNLEILRHCTGQDVPLSSTGIPSWAPRWDIKTRFIPLPDHLGSEPFAWHSSAQKIDELVSEFDHETVCMFLDHFPTPEIMLTTAIWRNWLSLLPTEVARLSTDENHSTQIETTARALSRATASDTAFVLCDRDVEPEPRSLAHWKERYHTSKLSHRPPTSLCLRTRAQKVDTIKLPTSIRCINQTNQGYISNNKKISFARLPCCKPCTEHYIAKPLCQRNPSISLAMLNEFSREINKFGDGRTMFVSKQSLGFTQVAVEKGDGVWALPGVRHLVVLRRMEQHYVVLGECYLYRALKDRPCVCCGGDVEPWRKSEEVIDIW